MPDRLTFAPDPLMAPKPASWWSAENELISRQHLLKPRALSAELIGLSRDELDWLDALATTANHAADSYRHSPKFTMAQRVEYMTGEDERLVKWLPKVVPVLDELCERLEEPFLAFAWEAWDHRGADRGHHARGHAVPRSPARLAPRPARACRARLGAWRPSRPCAWRARGRRYLTRRGGSAGLVCFAFARAVSRSAAALTASSARPSTLRFTSASW